MLRDGIQLNVRAAKHGFIAAIADREPSCSGEEIVALSKTEMQGLLEKEMSKRIAAVLKELPDPE
ncbi:hypothetical protein [Pseudovibrio sp. WM33]|uniref:hypothetical protein n=1 Tax=Pseudovibrio sp. WM33 TaxID=1735585 RepID=UPI0007AECB4C|nr:hypothetical protein [Pseudovibrio sp. WM33]KZL26052.1 hypothetical protein PsWM33_01577 [Pseudovibrio sp. WM33]